MGNVVVEDAALLDPPQVIEVKADKTATVDASGIINAALARGKAVHLPAGRYRVDDVLTVANGQKLFGDGATATVLVIDSSTFNMSADGVVQLGSSEPGGWIDGIGFEFTQPSTSVRASFTAYPPAIYAVAVPRFKVTNVRFTGAYDGIDMTGNSGGAILSNIEIGAINKGIIIDGSLDFVDISGIHSWPFGFQDATRLVAWKDGNTKALEFGRVDGLCVTNFKTFCACVEATSNATVSYALFSNLILDGDFSKFTVAAGYISVNNFTTTKSSAMTQSTIQISGGNVGIVELNIRSTAAASDMLVNGGTLRVNGGRLNQNDLSQAAAEITSGVMILEAMRFAWPPGARTKAYVLQSGGVIAVRNCDFPTAVGSSGSALSISSDSALNDVSGNNINSWDYSYPSALGTGKYGPNKQARKTFTPVLTFATPGDAVITYTMQTGYYWWEETGIRFYLRIICSTNAFTTASGDVTITGLPFACNVGQMPAPIGAWTGVDLAANYTQVLAVMSASGAYVSLRQSGDVVGHSNLQAGTNIKPSYSPIEFAISGFIYQ